MINNVGTRCNDIIEAEIKKSPYEIYSGETIERFIPENPRSYKIKGIQKEILLAINIFMCLTSRMLVKYLNDKGYDIEQKQIQKELKFLSQNDFLKKYQFKLVGDEKGVSSYKYYSIGFKGKAFLYNECNIYAKKMGYMEQCTVSEVKKVLSANQVIIELGLANEMDVSVVKMVVDEGFHLFNNKNLFRAIGYCESENKINIIEPVRSVLTYEKDLIEKLKRIERTLECDKCNIDIKKDITIIIVAENYSKMRYIMSWCEDKYKNFRMLFTYDTLFISSSKHKFFSVSECNETAEQLMVI